MEQMPRRSTSFLVRAFFGNHRIVVIGILGILAGVTGSAAAVSEGAGVLGLLAFLGIGAVGLFFTLGYVCTAASRRRVTRRPR
ncbi:MULTISPECIES: hypothetical protein [Streptomyces]|uniref:hypothetical protein n=1 Tax=Streptomyces TaxID=1883 RepID=UPI00081B9E00|nr:MULTISPECIES: hypothetical protein [unclassified Streptomyces]MYQ55118.1 hypothetical protein [Streptomyces sp. SID4941]SCE33006.1 hypothetical protein GA0115247_132115 [Streptomyces sp. PalvLS-984]SDC62493.1 hypothetical protein F558DRAFT_02317 [Streptomyces sp. AmelKG-A3]